MKDYAEGGGNADCRIGDRVPTSTLREGTAPEGRFLKTGTDDRGRTTRIEGWVDGGAAGGRRERDKDEAEAQKRIRTAAGAKEGQDASHLIPYSLGGRGEDNLVMMSDTMNRSHYRSIESAAEQEARDAAKCGEGVYITATVSWGDDQHVPQSVRYEVFRGERGGDTMTKVRDMHVRTDWAPKETLSRTLLDGPDPATPAKNREWTSTSRPDGMTMH